MGLFPVGSSEVRYRQTDKMLMPKKNLVAIYENLFKEGCMVAKKDTHAPKHPELDVPNLHVIKALTSLKSRGYVKEQFAWSHFYWYLTNEGIQYLRDYLHYHQKLSQPPLNVKPEQTPDRVHRNLHHQVVLVLIRLVLLVQDPLPWNSEVDSAEDKQNKHEVSFASSRWRSDYIFFFFDSILNLCKKEKRI